MQASGQIESIEVSAVIIRRDGTLKPLGTVASWHRRNPFMRFWRWIRSI